MTCLDVKSDAPFFDGTIDYHQNAGTVVRPIRRISFECGRDAWDSKSRTVTVRSRAETGCDHHNLTALAWRRAGVRAFAPNSWISTLNPSLPDPSSKPFATVEGDGDGGELDT